MCLSLLLFFFCSWSFLTLNIVGFFFKKKLLAMFSISSRIFIIPQNFQRITLNLYLGRYLENKHYLFQLLGNRCSHPSSLFLNLTRFTKKTKVINNSFLFIRIRQRKLSIFQNWGFLWRKSFGILLNKKQKEIILALEAFW